MTKLTLLIRRMNERLANQGLCYVSAEDECYGEYAQLRLTQRSKYLNGYQLHPSLELKEMLQFEANRMEIPILIARNGVRFCPK